jgi:hypothetical protein
MGLWALLDKAVRRRPEAVVLADDYGRALTAAGLRDEAERAAAGTSETWEST